MNLLPDLATAKDFGGGSVFGFYTLTHNQLVDPYNLEMVARVSREE